ncbi:PDZ/DHR/GLGF domain protein [Kribbella flavida DSM 17836]|uniref:endopeptidase La n=1 Tax=Kribbella flavida (strain DSM 17836 / JCM 10339 / NBRC 14399) TaxID=479435 RepID=D2PL69_KRIFD|nr:PDZ domain-containing protein [Kribbella flavida]ADB34324.1 PDZ/DHR/GLGF domain protein [Kribbella flavida DSM 17836]
MTRRTATLVTSIVVLVFSLGLVTVFPVPFVSFSPGPVKDTLGSSGGKPVVEVTGHETFPTDGQLDLTTVSVTSPDRDLTLPQAMRNWLDPHHDLFPRDIIYPPEQTADEVEQQNEAEMTGSQDSAVAAALQAAKVPFHPKVSTVSKGSPADGKLKPGDVVLEVDGVAATQVPQVGELVRKNKVGDDVDFLIRRGGAERTVVVKAAAAPGDPKRPMVGITIGVDSPVKVSVNLGQDIGGPSAGTAFALAIYDKLTPGPLLAGKHVAGTGTIDALGQVGAIGGIQQKIAGAKEAGATVFLVPAPNCEAALHAGVDGIQLVKMSTLDDAIGALKALGTGTGDVPSCTR